MVIPPATERGGEAQSRERNQNLQRMETGGKKRERDSKRQWDREKAWRALCGYLSHSSKALRLIYSPDASQKRAHDGMLLEPVASLYNHQANDHELLNLHSWHLHCGLRLMFTVWNLFTLHLTSTAVRLYSGTEVVLAKSLVKYVYTLTMTLLTCWCLICIMFTMLVQLFCILTFSNWH